jgi:hypothetical protein
MMVIIKIAVLLDVTLCSLLGPSLHGVTSWNTTVYTTYYYYYYYWWGGTESLGIY